MNIHIYGSSITLPNFFNELHGKKGKDLGSWDNLLTQCLDVDNLYNYSNNATSFSQIGSHIIHDSNKFQTDDVVIVQWPGLLRYNMKIGPEQVPYILEIKDRVKNNSKNAIADHYKVYKINGEETSSSPGYWSCADRFHGKMKDYKEHFYSHYFVLDEYIKTFLSAYYLIKSKGAIPIFVDFIDPTYSTEISLVKHFRLSVPKNDDYMFVDLPPSTFNIEEHSELETCYDIVKNLSLKPYLNTLVDMKIPFFRNKHRHFFHQLPSTNWMYIKTQVLPAIGAEYKNLDELVKEYDEQHYKEFS